MASVAGRKKGGGERAARPGNGGDHASLVMEDAIEEMVAASEQKPYLKQTLDFKVMRDIVTYI